MGLFERIAGRLRRRERVSDCYREALRVAERQRALSLAAADRVRAGQNRQKATVASS